MRFRASRPTRPCFSSRTAPPCASSTAKAATAQLGKSRSPFKGWTWKNLNKTIVGPNLLRLPDGRILAAGRLVGDTVRTSLFWVDPEANTVTEFYALPSGGDTGYPALGLPRRHAVGQLLLRRTKDRASIYLAKLRLPPAGEAAKPQRLTFGK